MKKLSKRSRKGFTLVELIVVIAILAILAAVAIPVYANYITKANEAADYTMLDSIKTAAAFVATENGVKETTPVAPKVTGITVNSSGVTVTTDPSVTVASADVLSYTGMTTISFKSGASSATWDGAKWTLSK